MPLCIARCYRFCHWTCAWPWEESGYDGARGSGILLATAFSRMLSAAEIDRGTPLTFQERCEFLTDRIFGGDVSEPACRVMTFSLYLSLLEELVLGDLALLMLWTMRSMYQDRKLNWILAGIFVAIMIGVFMLIRTQTPVDDEQFLHSMIPHHSGAILMCERSAITDQEIRRLCETIVKTQKDEIAQMEAILTRLN